MTPALILIYISIFFIAIIGTELAIVLFYVIKISRKADNVANFFENLVVTILNLEKLPLEILWKIIKKFF